MQLSNLAAFQKLETLSRVRQKEVFCPIARVRAIVSPLKVGDDLELKTAVMSPDLYDLEISHLIFKRTTFPDITPAIDFDTFLKNISFIDRQVLAWGMYNSTYNSFPKERIRCDNPKCDFMEEMDIKADDVLQPDSLTAWEQETPFTEYVKTIEKIIELDEIYKISFDTKIPTIQEHLEVLRLIPTEKLRDNFQKFANIMSRSEELCTITKNLKIYKTIDDTNPDILNTAKDIHYAISLIPMGFWNDIFEEYNENLKKYAPKFYKKYTCKKCGKSFDHEINMEGALLRAFLRND